MSSISECTHSTSISLPTLPSDVLFETFSYGDIADLCTWGEVCKLWHKVASKGALWSRFFQNDPVPLKTKQEFLAKFDGAITSETQLLRKLREFITAAPLGQHYDGHKDIGKGYFRCVFPFQNPFHTQCEFFVGFEDEGVIEDKKWQEGYLGYYTSLQHLSPKSWDFVFAKTLPDRRTALWGFDTCRWKGATWYQGVAYNEGCTDVNVLCPGGPFFSAKRYFHKYFIHSHLFTDSSFNATLKATIEGAITERTQAIDARKIRRNEKILAAAVAVIALGVFAVCQLFSASEELA